MDFSLVGLFGLGVGVSLYHKPKNLFKFLIASIIGLVAIPVLLNIAGVGGIPIPWFGVTLNTAIEVSLAGLLLGYAYKFLI